MTETEPMADNNGNVTVAILGVKLDNLSAELRDDLRELKQTLKDHCESEIRWRDAYISRLNAIELEQTRQKERLGIWAGLHGAYTTIAAIFASLIRMA